MGWTKHNVERVKVLTAEQEDQITIFAQKWDRIARSTEPWDRRAVVAGIRQFYKAIGARAPKTFCGFTSLAEAWNAAAYKTKDRLANGEWDTEAWKQFHTEHPHFYDLERSEWGTRCILLHCFEATVIKTVEDFMHRNIAQSMSPRRIEEIEDANEDTREHGRRIAYGQMDARWLAIVDYFATVHGDPHCQRFLGLLQAVASCGFIWLTPEKVVYTNRPNDSVFDEQRRLHCDDNVAIRFRDGWGFFFLHGIATPKQFVETPADDLKLEEILEIKNWEVRRAVLGKFGFQRMFTTVKHRVISRAGENALIQFKLDSGEFLRTLHLKWRDKTGNKEIFLPVPRTPRQFGAERPDNINDCEQVRRWTLGWPKEALAIAET